MAVLMPVSLVLDYRHEPPCPGPKCEILIFFDSAAAHLDPLEGSLFSILSIQLNSHHQTSPGALETLDQ